MPIPELPKETWLAVFALLDYQNLKKCLRVSKTFKQLTEVKQLDAVLFRDAVPIDGTAIDANTVNLHPAFEWVSNESATEIEDILFVDYNDEDFREWPLKDVSAAKEHATSPPVTELRLQVVDCPVFGVKNKNGVTVIQVMKALCKFFAKKVRGEEYTYRCTLGDHTGWTGFDEKEIDGKGRLLLRSVWFDS